MQKTLSLYDKTKKYMGGICSPKCMHTDVTLCLPANDEMRHGDQKGPKRHQQAPDCYDLGSVKFGTKIAHKGNHQQIPYRVKMIRRGDGDDPKGIKYENYC